jgi:phosphosulfolactate synthase
MRAELNAGATYVIAEAREAGNVGIYRGSGEVREGFGPGNFDADTC